MCLKSRRSVQFCCKNSKRRWQRIMLLKRFSSHGRCLHRDAERATRSVQITPHKTNGYGSGAPVRTGSRAAGALKHHVLGVEDLFARLKLFRRGLASPMRFLQNFLRNEF